GGLRLAPPRHARARTRGRAAGAWTGFRTRAAGARARAGIVGLLAGLLPDRAIAHRSDRRPAGAGTLPARGPARAARHRPRLLARAARGADPARARALRPRARGAGGCVSDLPRARGDPRAGQGARVP